ncbi:MAG TPA: GNAT family N-acetyltransferase [Planctomycetota bacterium]|nr:GNAT family N-acetyltransferase [Planctomycetota bacterium]
MQAPALRFVRANDFTAIAALTNVFIRTTAIHFGYQEVTADELRAAWQQKQELYPWLVAEIDGTFAGFAKAGPWRDRAAYQWTPETSIYLQPEQRGRGLGRSLYSRLLELLRAQGFRSAIGGITLPNPASVALHEALGFVHTGTVREAGCKFDAWHDVGFWQLRLRDDAGAGGPLLPPAAAWAALPAP